MTLRTWLLRLLGLFWFLGCVSSSPGANDNRWRKISAPEFTLISELSDRQSVAWAEEFAQFIAALKNFLPVDTRALPPLTIVVLRDRDFMGYRPLGADGRAQEVGGFFSRRPSWSVAGLGTADFDRVRNIIFHEGTHWFMSAFRSSNPVWVEEGIAELFSTFAVEGKSAQFGKAVPSHIQALNALGLMPMEKLMYLARSDLFQGDSGGEERTGIAYAQSWAFMHYLIFGENAAATRKAFIGYLRALRDGIHPDEAFKSTFGKTYAQMDTELSDYVRNGRYFTLKSALAPAANFKPEAASTMETELALGRLSLAARRFKEALTHVAAAGIGPNDGPEAFVLQGEIYAESGDAEKAQAAFEQALAKGAKDFRPHYELARLQHRAAFATGGAVSTEDARRIANGYERAINANPQFRFSYVGLANLAGRLPAGPTDDKAFLELGLKIFPSDPEIQLGLAVLARRDGELGKALQLFDQIINSPSRPPTLPLKGVQSLRSAVVVEDVTKRMAELQKEKKFDEAIMLATESSAQATDTITQRRFDTMRRAAQYAKGSEAIRVAAEASNWVEVRRLTNELIQSGAASPNQQTQLENRLKDLDRRGLGKE